MLRQAKEFNSFKLRATDGDIGKVKEFYFDDHYWTVRYLIADTGSWLNDRLVLISPYALAAAIEQEQVVPVNLTKKQVEDSPSLDSDKPVSRQYEAQYYDYYGWPMYWNGLDMWGAYSYPILYNEENRKKSTHHKETWDPNLRSTGEVTGHHIHALDGEIGHVEDFIIDDKTWSIRYLVIDTKNWWPGKHVLVSPQWIQRVSWGESQVFLNLSREGIKQSPEYKDGSLPTRDYETRLHKHYDRQGYWTDEPAVKQALKK